MIGEPAVIDRRNILRVLAAELPVYIARMLRNEVRCSVNRCPWRAANQTGDHHLKSENLPQIFRESCA